MSNDLKLGDIIRFSINPSEIGIVVSCEEGASDKLDYDWYEIVMLAGTKLIECTIERGREDEPEWIMYGEHCEGRNEWYEDVCEVIR